ncbi:hypothetical protein BE21_19120 [Sorangium cellulosum]|uniref:IPT/TIG domain-containing protein n=1 Tax=Sorangium cellulosum TaxID=56 RepID=A0A150TX04_SORCE|nr:hypothetical protein BE21_19120 [Sorangium cellulosum]
MAHNQNLLNALASGGFAPARSVVNALAVSYQSSGPSAARIRPPAYAAVNRASSIEVTPGTSPEGERVKVQCGSLGSNFDTPPYDSGLLSDQRPVIVPMTWSTPGSMTIYCTTFSASGRASPGASSVIQVAQVDGIVPSSARLNERTTFTVVGKNLPQTTVAFIPHCAGPEPGEPTLFTTGMSAERRPFVCTPGAAGVHKSTVKHDKGGIVLGDNIDISISP